MPGKFTSPSLDFSLPAAPHARVENAKNATRRRGLLLLTTTAVLLAAGCVRGGRGIPTEIVAEANRDARLDRTQVIDAPVGGRIRRRLLLDSQGPPGMRQSAADALARIGQPAVPSLRAALQDPDVSVRVQVCEILGRIGPRATDAVDDLTRIVADPRQPAELRQAATVALGRIGPDASAAIPVLVGALREES